MRILFATVMLLLVGAVPAVANYIQIENVSIGDRESDHVVIKFDLKWQNSFRTNINDPIRDNWDAAWVFIKWRLSSDAGNDVAWSHAYLSPTGHLIPTNSHSSHGGLTNFTYALGKPDENSDYQGNPAESGFNPYVGAFIYSSDPGAGHVQLQQVKLHWDFVASGLAPEDQVDVKVFGIEMVYVPEGPFWLGDGSGAYDNPNVIDMGNFVFHRGNDPFAPYHINSENTINIGTGPDELYYNIGDPSTVRPGYLLEEQVENRGDQLGPLPDQFPKGFRAFYAMKHEITQQSYVDFLNCLPPNIASERITTTQQTRHAIGVPIDGVYSTTNPHLPKNYMSWADMAAFLDWTGLRPMTELEFEKAARGPVYPIPNEYVMGGHISTPTKLENIGSANETVSINFRPERTEGKIGNAQFFSSFDEEIDYNFIAKSTIEIPDNEMFNFSGDFTIQAWAKAENLYAPNVNRGNTILSKWTGRGASVAWWLAVVGYNNSSINPNPLNTVAFGHYTVPSTIGRISQGTELFASDLNVWQKIVVVRRDSNVEIWENGEIVSVSPVGVDIIGTEGGNITIGNIKPTSSWPWHGKIDEIRIANKALSAAWIKTDYYSTSNNIITINSEETGENQQYRRAIEVDHNKVDETLTNFPILVKLDNTNFDFLKCAEDGIDINFYDSNNNPLYFERERHNYDLQVAEYWVRIPNLNSETNTVFYLEYGTDTEDNENSSLVWSGFFLGVWHLSEGTEDISFDGKANYIYYDSSPHNNHAFTPRTANVSRGIPGEPLGYPLRVGIFANENTNRFESGASYWGILDLSGNVRETIITVGNPEGRGFCGKHGDGSLLDDLHANVTNWPLENAIGTGARGGGNEQDKHLRISSRWAAAYPSSARTGGRAEQTGGRGVRTAPVL